MDLSNKQLLLDCETEISGIQNLITNLGTLSKPVPYLTRYSIIKCCGTIEHVFKAIISDKLSISQHPYVCNFIDSKIRKSSMNPSYDNITKLLATLDDNLCLRFKACVKAHPDSTKISTGLKSLVDLRNDFAHGSNINASIQDIVDYFKSSVEIINLLDSVL